VNQLIMEVEVVVVFNEQSVTAAFVPAAHVAVGAVIRDARRENRVLHDIPLTYTKSKSVSVTITALG